MKVILNPTEQCNLRCSYCYESFLLKQMPTEVINGVVRLVARRVDAGLDWLEIEFFGGEPLAAWAAVRRLSIEIQDVCRKAGVPLYGAMTTNGTLLNSTRLDTLVANDIRLFQITLDGPRQLHDSRRKSAKGLGSFERIWTRLELLRDSSFDLKVMLRIHFDALSARYLVDSDFLPSLSDQFLKPDARFLLHFKPLEVWSSKAKSEVHSFESVEAEARTLALLLQRAKDAGIPKEQLPQTKSNAFATGESGHVVCYAASANAFVIRSDGRVSKCTVAFDDDRNIVGKLTPTGNLEIDHERHLPWLRGLMSGDPKSLACPAIGHLWT